MAGRSLALAERGPAPKLPESLPSGHWPPRGRGRSSEVVTELTRLRANARHRSYAVAAPTRSAATGSAHDLIRLQREAGNGAVVQLLSGDGPDGVHGVAGAARAGRSRATAVPLQRAIKPEDLTEQMRGARFQLSADFSGLGVTLKAGETVEVTVWDNASEEAIVRRLPPHPPAVQFGVPKKLLRPVASGVAGITPYSAGLGEVTGDFERGEQKIAAEKGRTGGARADEITRLEGLQKKRLKHLNRRLIQGSFLNRFDADIRKWTDFYNTKYMFTGADALDPNLVKAMLFQETQMGTTGQHLEDLKETGPLIKTRQNVLQNIDSGAEALLELIPEEAPAIAAKHGLDQVRKDLAKVRKTESFLWNDPRFTAAVTEFFADVPAGNPERNVDYGFWIKSGIRWLFHKRMTRRLKSWEDAARAYNGGGGDADRYKREVLERMAAGAKAEAASEEFIPGKL
jgi:hypothetical protein